ncbi:unnamed protein product (macronuclear) [Paramecium tetraurelia]|uniref:Protein kinase domain-containing protein n=1 Tax=Paramecium tetraurelia TaxID=5888 RepID=A0E2J1_PARTE|nr:uncharacterized protein GSPATT00022680001 [Paramecium tetraurelia]CAK89508.1 unnamed protein product [Paramecium tetraurelia]|eukprot:XP_001456905.1 hypothetical protein (macronuclear) [Paramecium tetraurelia strain d4-2]
MDFEINDSIQAEKRKYLLLTLNGQPDANIIRFRFFQRQICMADIKTKAENYYQMKIQCLRLFTQQGIEIFQEDLPYIKEGTLLYISDSSDFDAYSQISVYQIMKVLGEGGFGKVMLGKHKVTGEQVAIKLIDSGKLWNAEDIDLVFREAEVMKNLRHNNIIKILNCYTLPNMQVVLIMEFLQGGDLVEYIQEKGGLSEEEARVIFRQIAEAIRYCHDKRLIHRDLKLENVLLTSKVEKMIKIIDFGIATVSTNFTIDKVDRGSLSYMPPEVVGGQATEIRPAIDIWALGVILYALVCANLPFTSRSDEQTIDNILKCNYTFPSHLILSKEYKELVANMLNPDQSERYSAYQILGHPWMQKVLTQSPTKMLNPRTLANKKNKKPLIQMGIKKEITMAGPSRHCQQPQLRAGATMLKTTSNQGFVQVVYDLQARNFLKQEDQSSPRSSLNFLGDLVNKSNQEPDEIINTEKPKTKTPLTRKYSDFNQKLIDKIFLEDSKREKIKQWRKNQVKKQGNHFKSQSQGSIINCAQNNYVSARSANTSPLQTASRSGLQSPNLVYSVRGTAKSKRKPQSQLEIQTILNLSQKIEWKQLFASPTYSSRDTPLKIQKTNQHKAEQLYKIQNQFKQRKRNSDNLLQKQLNLNNKEITIQKLCSIIFSSRVRASNK